MIVFKTFACSPNHPQTYNYKRPICEAQLYSYNPLFTKSNPTAKFSPRKHYLFKMIVFVTRLLEGVCYSSQDLTMQQNFGKKIVIIQSHWLSQLKWKSRPRNYQDLFINQLLCTSQKVKFGNHLNLAQELVHSVAFDSWSVGHVSSYSFSFSFAS